MLKTQNHENKTSLTRLCCNVFAKHCIPSVWMWLEKRFRVVRDYDLEE